MKGNSNKTEIALKLFKIGIFLILSAPTIGSLFILSSVIFISFYKHSEFLKNRFNYPLIICSLILLISTFLNTTFLKSPLIGWEPYLSWVGLANWIPLFYCYWAFQELLPSSNSIKKIIKIFCMGSIPFFVSGFSQIWLNWHGPFRILNNLIIWYQRPVDLNHPYNGMTSLFSNQNYAGAWLVIIWPMFLACLFQRKLSKYKKLILLFLSFSTLISVYLTRSRNAWFGTFISTHFVLDRNISIGVLIFFVSVAILLIFLNQFSQDIFSNILQNIIPPIFITKFSEIGFDNISSYPRILQWQNSIDFISQRPLIGWGAGSFPILFENKNNYETYAHPHNLILDLANSYGLIPSLIISVFVIVILFRSFKRIYIFPDKNCNLTFKKAWWASTFTLTLTQLVDIQYFDLRISITFWILLAGLTNMLRKESQNLT